MFKQSTKTLTMDGFGGIGAEVGGGRIVDAVNFRIRPDGSLEKRCGYRCIADVGSSIRAFFSGLFEGRFAILLLAENTVYTLSLDTEVLTPLCTVGCAEGNACFFCYGGLLYLMDGKALYVIRESEAIPAVGYAPLIGKDWPCDVVGEPYEPRNLLTRHARISYLVGTPASSMLCTKYPVESVEAVYLNNVRLSADRYQVDPTFHTVNIAGLATGDRVLIYLTFTEGIEALPDAFYTCTEAVLFGSADRNRLFFRGGGMRSALFCSAYVDEASREASLRHYPGIGCLFIPQGYEFTVGDGRYRVQGMVPHHDRLLIFTEGDTWMAKRDASGMEEFPIASVHSRLGCASESGVAAVGNEVLSVGRNAVLRWKDVAESSDRCTVQSISDAVSSFFGSAAELGLTYHEGERLLLCYDRGGNTILLCDPDKGEWFRYTGIRADSFFDADGAIGFRRGGRLFLMDRTLTEDHAADGQVLPIRAEYAGERMDLGCQEVKRLSGITLYGCLDGKSVQWSLTEDGKRTLTHSLSYPDSSSYAVFDRRVPSGRFRYADFRLSAKEPSRPILHRLSLHRR